ncbi:2267_t:CDS:2, partial [Entrophospora sp. SA101]
MFSLPAARQIKDMSTWGEAWDKRLIDEKVGFYPYEEFDDVKEIADGSFGNVYRANWKTSDKVVVIKSFGNYNQNAKQVIKDLKALNLFALKALEIKKKTSMHDQNYLARDLDIKNRLSIGTDINSLRSMLGQLALTHTTEPSIFRPKPSNLDPLLIDSTTTTTTASTTLNTPTQPTSGPSEINPGVSIEPDVTTTSFKSKNNEPPMFEKEQIQVFVEEPISTKTTETIDNHVIDSKKYDFISKLENKLEIPKKEIQKPLPEKLPDKESENINSKVTTTIAMMTKKSEPDKLTSEPSKNVPSTPSKKVESLANGLNQKILKTEEVKIGSDEKKVNKEESPSLNKKQNPNPINPIDNVVTKEIKNTSSSNNGGISIIKKRLSLSLNNDSNSTIPKLIKEPIVNSSSIAKLKSDLENNSANDKTEKVPLGNQSMNKLNKDFSLVNGSSTPKSDKETTTANKLNPISEFQQKEDTATQNTDSSLLLGLGNSVKNFKDKLEPPAPTKPNPPSTKSVKSRRISISSAKSDDSSKGDIYTPPKLSRRISIKKSDIPTRPDFPRLKNLSQIIIQRTESALTIKSSSKSKSSWISETQINSNGTIDDIAQTPVRRKGKFVPKKFIDELHRNEQHYVVIVDPGLKIEDGYEPYDDGVKRNVFIKNSDLDNVVGRVWPGLTVFPDWFNNETEIYWGDMIEKWLDANWCNGECGKEDGDDVVLNKPLYRINNGGSKLQLNTLTLPMNAIHVNGFTEYNVHNLFGHMEAITTHKVLAERINKGKRPFIISRSTFPGSGKYTGHWTGDNKAQWEHLYLSIPGILNFQLFGVPMVGADICGFDGPTNEELCLRWMQLGSFYPFMSQEPYIWSSVKKTSRKYLSIRYSLLPYIYTLFYENNKHGPGLLISPVLQPNTTTVENAFIPDGLWYDFYTKKLSYNTTNHNGEKGDGEFVNIESPLDHLSLLVRGGNILPLQYPGLTTKSSRKSNFYLIIALDESGYSTGNLYLDDGESLTVEQNYSYINYKVLDHANLISNSKFYGYKLSSNQVIDKLVIMN